VLDIAGKEKQQLTVEELIARFNQISGEEFADDQVLLG
jgi:putative ABC transport system ATP-binding protein